MAPKPETWWLPYYSNSAFAARGLKGISQTWRRIKAAPETDRAASDWLRRSKNLQDAVAASIRKNVRSDMNPPYIGTDPGATDTFRQSMEEERPSQQHTLESVTVNGQPAKLGGTHNDVAIFSTGNSKRFEIVARFA